MFTVTITFDQPVLINGEGFSCYMFTNVIESKAYDVGNGVYQIITEDERYYAFPLHNVCGVEMIQS